VRFIGFVLLLCFISCEFDNSESKPAYTKVPQLEFGEYLVADAYRNGKKTSSLNGGFYRINGDSIETNLSKNLDSLKTSYKYKNNRITHNDEKALNFDVVNQSSDSLRLLTEIRGFTFELILLRADTLDAN